MLEDILREIEEEAMTNKEYGRKVVEGMAIAMSIIRKHLPDNDDKCSKCSRRKFYQMGYHDGATNDLDWIPVEDGLPEEKYQKNKVWITIETEKGNRATVMGYEYCGKFHFSNGNEIKKYKVIAWKPYTYPKPYRKDEE